MLEKTINEIRKFPLNERIDQLNKLLEQRASKEDRKKILEEIKKIELEIQLTRWKEDFNIAPEKISKRQEPEETVSERKKENLEEIANEQQLADNKRIDTKVYGAALSSERTDSSQNIYGRQEQKGTYNKSESEYSKKDDLDASNKNLTESEKRLEEKEHLNRRESVLGESTVELMKKYRSQK